MEVIKIKAVCYIFGAAEADEFNIEENSFIIAADGGLKALNKKGINPDLIVGDFDSLGYKPEGENVICHKPEKDDTDLMLAIKEGLDRGYKTFVLYGCLGGREDHTFANMSALSFIAENGGRGFIFDGNEAVCVIKNGSISFSEKEQGIISVFSFGCESRGVSISGLKYGLCDYTMKPYIPIGVSNEFLGKKATVTVKDGTLIVMWETTYSLLRENILL